MSIAILSIPIGIIAIFLFIWSINKMGEKPAKGKKKDDDTGLIGIIVSMVLFFVALGIFDGSESTAGFFAEDNSSKQQSSQRGASSSKSEAEREVEEHNREVVEKARSGQSDDNSKSDNKSNNNGNKNEETSSSSSSTTNSKDANETTTVNKVSQNKNLEKQQQAYQKWHTQLEDRLQVIDNTWSALWNEGSAESIEKLGKALDNSKAQLEELKVPEELSAIHKQKLTEALGRYVQWIDSYRKACQMKSSNGNQQDIIAEVARGDGLKLRSNVEVSGVGRELGISD